MKQNCPTHGEMPCKCIAASGKSGSADGSTPQYRLLEEGEQFQVGDEHLCDDCETWAQVLSIFFKCEYNPRLFQPTRRRLA